VAPSRDDLPLWLVTIPFRHPRDQRKGEQTFRVRAGTAREAREQAWRQAQRPAALAHRRGRADPHRPAAAAHRAHRRLTRTPEGDPR
jgi:hypothetical protein